MTKITWRKSTHSNEGSECVELSNSGLVRDSKNPNGPTLTVELTELVAAVKSSRLDH